MEGMAATDDGEDPEGGHDGGYDGCPSHDGVLNAGSVPGAFEAGDEGVKREGVEDHRDTDEDGVDDGTDV